LSGIIPPDLIYKRVYGDGDVTLHLDAKVHEEARILGITIRVDVREFFPTEVVTPVVESPRHHRLAVDGEVLSVVPAHRWQALAAGVGLKDFEVLGKGVSEGGEARRVLGDLHSQVGDGVKDGFGGRYQVEHEPFPPGLINGRSSWCSDSLWDFDLVRGCIWQILDVIVFERG